MEDTNINSTENIENTSDSKQCDTSCNCKCRLSLFMNLVLFAGLVVLYILYFMDKKSGNVDIATFQKSNKTVSIGYVNSDSITKNYLLALQMKDSLEAHTKKSEAQFAAAQSAWEAKVTAYQKNVSSLSVAQATATEKSLMQQKENLYAMNEELSAKLSEKNLEMYTVLVDSVKNCLKRYNKKNNFDFILGVTKESNILYANESLDITNEIIKELNKDYKSN